MFFVLAIGLTSYGPPEVLHPVEVDEPHAAAGQVRIRVREQQPIGRLGTAEEIANAVLWLCSPTATFVSASPCPWTRFHGPLTAGGLPGSCARTRRSHGRHCQYLA
ncbi:SDR family oxidoreductase [Streptomyces sp. NPDC048521]|uniref:SDR family oxidoreductase n=1 Tax=Streptomyces sp. NPDC048521 TaxID=3365566 RepID=UPI0037240F3F